MDSAVRPEPDPAESPIARVYLSRAERAARRGEYDRLRHRYADLSGTARRCSADPRIGQRPLLELAGRLVAPGRSAFEALQEVDSPSEKAALPEEIGEGLAEFAARIDPLARELQLLDSLTSTAEELHDVLADLAATGRGPVQPLLALARRILADVREAADGRLTHPRPGVDVLQAVLAKASGGRPAVEACVAGVLAARLTAWAAPQFERFAPDAELLTAACLAADAGLVYWSAVGGIPSDVLRAERPSQFREHPQLSRALAGGLEGASSTLLQVVGTHHERLDGSGYPARWNHWRIGPLQRLAQIAVRFTELRFESPPADPGTAYVDDAGAARRLFNEAERGHWDAEWTRGMLLAIDQSPATRPLDEPRTAPALTEFGRRRLRLDGAHTRLSGPHYQRTAETVITRPHFLRQRSTERAAKE